jgi:hypothetical protein
MGVNGLFPLLTGVNVGITILGDSLQFSAVNMYGDFL